MNRARKKMTAGVQYQYNIVAHLCRYFLAHTWLLHLTSEEKVNG